MTFTAKQQTLSKLLRTFILAESESGPVSKDSVNTMAENIAPGLGLTPLEMGQVIHRLSSEMSIFQDADLEIVDPDSRSDWLQKAQNDHEAPRWNAYKELLNHKGWSANVLRELDKQTDSVVELLGNPSDKAGWSRPRSGLLMGDVQSGKTATYIGIMNKAIDYGFRIFVLIAGHTDDLRRQTQERIDSDLIGKDSALYDHNIVIDTDKAEHKIGIGSYLNDGQVTVLPMTSVGTITGTNGDFRADSYNATRFSISENLLEKHAFVFVVKKNVRVLNNVTRFITREGKINIPLVVIDDESDWGSPNTNSPDTDPTQVNQRIRELLAASSRSSYLAITATPFANVLINHEVEDDLFPRDYIRALTAPSNYHGANKFFNDDEAENRIFTDVSDCLAQLPLNHKPGHRISSLPLSLKRAILTFAAGVAIKRTNQNFSDAPASMLINVSRFKLVQSQIRRLVSDYVKSLQQMADAELHRDTALHLFSDLAQDLINNADSQFAEEFDWNIHRAAVIEVLNELNVKLVNSDTAKERTSQAKMEEEHFPTIFIGGDVLSRGLTLSGLMVSYFIRQPSAADTLLQMGRWFGYRDGYDHLVRIWMPSRTVDLFKLTSYMVQEFRDQLAEMKRLRLKPTEFGLGLRQIPDFAVVASNKRRAAQNKVVAINPNGQVLPTNRLSWSKEIRESNSDAVRRLSVQLSSLNSRSGENLFVWDQVPEELVFQFLSTYQTEESDPYFGLQSSDNPSEILKYIGALTENYPWKIAFVSGNGDATSLPTLGHFKTSIRNKLIPKESNSNGIPAYLEVAHRSLQSPGDLAKTLDQSEMKIAERRREELNKPTIDDFLARQALKYPTLMLYALTTKIKDRDRQIDSPPDIHADNPLWAVRVAFPNNLSVEEPQQGTGSNMMLVNSVYLKNLLASPEDESPDEDEE